jgi:hypothetical protein
LPTGIKSTESASIGLKDIWSGKVMKNSLRSRGNQIGARKTKNAPPISTGTVRREGGTTLVTAIQLAGKNSGAGT